MLRAGKRCSLASQAVCKWPASPGQGPPSPTHGRIRGARDAHADLALARRRLQVVSAAGPARGVDGNASALVDDLQATTRRRDSEPEVLV